MEATRLRRSSKKTTRTVAPAATNWSLQPQRQHRTTRKRRFRTYRCNSGWTVGLKTCHAIFISDWCHRAKLSCSLMCMGCTRSSAPSPCSTCSVVFTAKNRTKIRVSCTAATRTACRVSCKWTATRQSDASNATRYKQSPAMPLTLCLRTCSLRTFNAYRR